MSIIKPYIEKTIMVGNPEYPQWFSCGDPGCGHDYDRHFDSYGLDPWSVDAGCKYCDCMEFVEDLVKQGDTICHSSFPPGVKPTWAIKVLGFSIEHDQIWVVGIPKKQPSDKPELRSYQDVVNQIRKGEWIVR